MGFRRPLVFIALTVAAAPLALAQSASSADSAQPAAAATAAAPATPVDAAKAAEARFTKLKAVATKPGDAKAGQAKAAVCGACHGMDGNSSLAMYPKLAGQNERYIVTQLMRFKSGVRTSAIMAPMAAPLSPQDMHDLGAYFAEQKVVPGVADEQLASDGAKVYHQGDASRDIPACAACHGPAGRGNPGWRVPQIAGQHADYVQKQLQAWHDGAVWGTDAHAQIMPTIAQRLTADEIAAVSSYVEGLHAAPAPKTAATANAID